MNSEPSPDFGRYTRADGEAEYWLEPDVELARNYQLSGSQLKEIEQIIEARYDELTSAWQKHFGR